MNSCTDDTFPETTTAIAPTTPTPVTPAVPTAAVPVTPTPVTPAVPTPAVPVTPTPVTPAVPVPVVPVTPAPVTPAVPAPVVPVTPPVASNVYLYSAIENEILALINTYRISAGLKALVKTDYISNQAEQHNAYMITNNILDHAGFDTRYQNIKNALGARSVGENVAFGYTSAQAVVNGWLASPGHKANIEGDFTNFGISVRSDSAGKKYFTNIFAKI
jgi:uncharacterized protein YkwD